jgi:hypothetical protein
MLDGPEDADPATILETNFALDGVTLADFTRFLDPVNWPDCCDLWCSMDMLDPVGGSRCYLEVISLDCPDPPELHIPLEFRTIEFSATVAKVEYQLCSHPEHQPPNGVEVDVDGGLIQAIEAAGGLNVKITKRVRFTSVQLHGEAMSMAMCALGYGFAAEEMAYTCALEKKDVLPGTPFQPFAGAVTPAATATRAMATMAATSSKATTATAAKKTGAKKAAAKKATTTTTGATAKKAAAKKATTTTAGATAKKATKAAAKKANKAAEPKADDAAQTPPEKEFDFVGAVVADLAEFAGDWSRRMTSILEASATKAQAGTYGVGDLVGDAAKMWAGAAVDLSRIVAKAGRRVQGPAK